MKKLFGMLAVAALLAACADEEAIEGDGGTGGGGTVGQISAGGIAVGDLKSAAIENGELVVQISLDSGVAGQVYSQAGTLTRFDTSYDRYTLQISQTDRFFKSFAGLSNDASAEAFVVVEAGQFNRFLGGAVARQNNYTAPDGGIVNYQGGYVGMLNFGPSNGGVSGSISATPNEALEVTGQVFFKADFIDNKVNGAIFNRQYIDGEIIVDLPEIVLIIDDIASDGSFAGTVELVNLTGVGSYSGLFGGNGATSVAGIIELGAGFLAPGSADPEIVGNEAEFGIFVLGADGP